MIKSQNDNDQASLTMNGHVIESTEDIRLLGVNNDVHFVISKHISEQCKKKKSQPKIGCPVEIKKPNPYGSKIAFMY